MDNLQDKLKVLKVGYLKKLQSEFCDFEALLTPEIDIEAVYSRVHKVSGTAGMYGLRELSDLSCVFEVYLKEIKANPESLNKDELLQKFSKYLEEFKSKIQEGA